MADKARADKELPVVKYSSQEVDQAMGDQSESSSGTWEEPEDPFPRPRRERRTSSPDPDFRVETEEV